MPKSSKRKRAGKARQDFPLFRHQTGRWCKKVRGRFRYFGHVADDPDGAAALEKWLAQKDDLLAGREPRPAVEGLTVSAVCNHFLTHKLALVESGELAQRTFDRYRSSCARVVATFSRDRVVEDLRPDDFQRLRTVLARRFGPVALGVEIQMVRSLFRYGAEAELFDKTIRFGPGFRKPTAKTLRMKRAEKGPRLFTREEILALLDHAGPNMAAMILLGIGGGLGNTDLALLPIDIIDLKGGWLDYPRAKTAIPRRIPLWPQTVEAVKEALANRPEPSDPTDDRLLFIGPRRESYVGQHKGYRVAQEFVRVAEKAGVEGRAFYDLRRTFQTIAEGARDLAAVQSIMGHAPAANDMSALYRQHVDDDRLLAVTEHVRRWLFGAEETR